MIALPPNIHRYHFNTNLLLAPITKQLKWAEGAAVRAELLAAVEALLGPKTEADLKPPEKKKKPKVRAHVQILVAA
jgi:glutaminyl-tRNA synthetase